MRYCPGGGTVYAAVLEAAVERHGGSSPLLGTIIKEIIMKQITFENIYNKERYISHGKRYSKFIDGIEYIKVISEKNKIEVLIRKDFVKKVN